MTHSKFALKEKYWVLTFAVVLVLITGLPYVLAATNPKGGFSGFLIGVEDGNSYIAKMLAGASGDWLFRSPYSTLPQTGVLLYLPYLLLGKLFGPAASHGQLVLLFHLFRSISLVLLCLATYDFLAYFLRDVRLRRLGLALATLGSGLGWIPLAFGAQGSLASLSLPLDFYSPETFGFLANFTIPHLVLARALLFWGLLMYLRTGETHPKWKSALIWLAMALCHLITAALGLGLLTAHLFYRWFTRGKGQGLWNQFVISAGWAVLGSAPILIVDGWVYLHDAYLQNWAAQNQTLSPDALQYLFAYGWLLPLAILGLQALWRKENEKGSFLLVWLLLLPFILYAPIGLQRRLAEGAWVMLIVLSLYVFQEAGWVKYRKILLVFAFSFPSTLILLLGSWRLAANPAQPIFLPRTEILSFEALRATAARRDIVLTSYSTGNALPAYTPQRVVLGHGSETVNSYELGN